MGVPPTNQISLEQPPAGRPSAGRGSRRLDVALTIAWSWLVVSTILSWTLHPLRSAVENPGPMPHLVALHGIHWIGLLLFAALCRWRSAAVPGVGMAWLLVGLGYVLAHRHFGPNELAGILLFFIPWALATALADSKVGDATPGPDPPVAAPFDPRAGRMVALAAALLFLGMLYHSSSRSGLGACAMVLVPMLWWLGRRGRRTVRIGIGGAFLWLVAGGWSTFLEFFVFDDKGQRLTAYTFLTGRPHIWLRHAQAVADMPFTGVGLGASEKVVGELYPLSRFEPMVHVEDAHNFFLHVASELGLLSLLALWTLLAVAACRLIEAWRQAPEGRQRARVLGLAAGLTAYLIYGSVDVVAFGQIGSLPFWCLLGLACQPTAMEASRPVRPTSPRPRRRKTSQVIARCLAALAALAALGVGLRHRIDFNLAVLETANVLLVAPERHDRVSRHLAKHTDRRCHSHYFIARLADRRGDIQRRDDAFRALFRCSDDFDDLVAFLVPDNPQLAEQATRRHPHSAAAHLWRARQLVATDPDQRLRAEAHYRSALDLGPNDGRAWIELGNLLYHHDRQSALQAYGEACRRGDYYGQGC